MTAGVAGIGLVCAPRLGTAADVPRAPRPTPPYRVWFQPRLFHRDMDLYRHMTIDASCWLDPQFCAARSVSHARRGVLPVGLRRLARASRARAALRHARGPALAV